MLVMKKIMKLNKEQIKNLYEVTDFILTFEEMDYLDWQKREGRRDGHVYYYAKKLWDELELEHEMPAHRSLKSWETKLPTFESKLEEMRKYPHRDNHMD
jgi:cytoplasmic iron level regulating protein YaaA (DUF328/UPF0246 family)